MPSPSLLRRIEALEARFASGGAPPPMHPVARVLNVLVAYYLGGAGPSDSIAEGMARGLGYDSPQDFRSALMARSNASTAGDLDTRWRDALRRLFSLKGATPDCNGPTFCDTLVVLFADMPERLQHHPYFSSDDRLPGAIYDIVL